MTTKRDSKKLRVLITGASDGIGYRLLKLFCEDGADVIGTGSRNHDALPADWPRNVKYLQANQGKPQVARKISKFLNQEGWDGLDHLILNAGAGWVTLPEAETVDALEETLAVNLLSPILITRALHDKLDIATNGKVTLIGSAARHGNQKFASYSASKAGLAGFGRALESEWRGRIAVQIIEPGAIATDMHKRAGLSKRWFHRFFVNPDFAAAHIFALIKGSKSVVRVGHLDWAMGFLRSLVVAEKFK